MVGTALVQKSVGWLLWRNTSGGQGVWRERPMQHSGRDREWLLPCDDSHVIDPICQPFLIRTQGDACRRVVTHDPSGIERVVANEQSTVVTELWEA